MFDFIMWLFIMGVPLIVMSYWSISEYLNEEKLHSIIITITSLIPFLNWIGLLVIGLTIMLSFEDREDIFDKQNYLNTVKKCRSCGINSRYGRALRHKYFNGVTDICPFCESHNMTSIYGDEKAPLSKRFGLIETFSLQNKINKYYKLKEEEGDIAFTDSQLERYQKIQEEKLEKMMKERMKFTQ